MKEEEINPVGALVRELEEQYVNGNIQTSKYVNQNPYEDINTIDAYLNSKHTSGEFDALGREKPFFNIVIAARNLWFRGTDLDRKDVRIKSTRRKNVLSAMIATFFLQDWMRKSDFGMFLNKWGITLAGYLSAVVKSVEQDGELHMSVIPWDKLIYDSIDFANNPKIEILEFTPAQLRKHKGYDKKMVEALIDAVTTRKNLDRQNKDTKSNYIRLYEVHGELPLSYITGKEKDEEEYVQQMHVVSFVAGKNKGEYDDYCLVSGREDKDPYTLTYLIPSVDGSVSFDGAVKNLFQTQWMTNHTVKQIKDQLDLASMLIFQTSDGNFAGQNALQAMVTGDILIHASNQPLSQLNNNSHDITALQNYASQWRAVGQEITSTPDIMMGKNMPSGTAYRQAAIIQQESNSNFQIMTETKGICLENLVRNNIIPFLKKKAKNKDEIVAKLSDYGIDKIEAMYVKNEAAKKTNEELINQIIAGEEPTLETQASLLQKNTSAIQEDLSQSGEERFLVPSEIEQKTWDDIFDDLEWEVEVNVTGESSDKQATLTTLTEVLGTIARNPMVLQDPNAKSIFNKILIESDVMSPLEMSSANKPIQSAQPSPAVGGVGGSALPVNQ